MRIKKAVRTPYTACSPERGISTDRFLEGPPQGAGSFSFSENISENISGNQNAFRTPQKSSSSVQQSSVQKGSSQKKQVSNTSLPQAKQNGFSQQSDSKFFSSSFRLEDVGHDHGSILSGLSGISATYLGTDPARHPSSDLTILSAKSLSRPGTSDMNLFVGGIQRNTTKSLKPLVDRKTILPSPKPKNPFSSMQSSV